MSYNSVTSCVIMGALAPEVSSCFGTRLIKNIGPSDKLHSALGKYPIMHQFVTEMCTHVHILITIWCIVGYGTGVLWDLCNRPNGWMSWVATFEQIYLASRRNGFLISTNKLITTHNMYFLDIIIYTLPPYHFILDVVQDVSITLPFANTFIPMLTNLECIIDNFHNYWFHPLGVNASKSKPKLSTIQYEPLEVPTIA